MFKAARLSKIKELIRQDGEVNVLDLSGRLGVTSVTIRSDLEELEQTGVLQRTHGGAILLDERGVGEDSPGHGASPDLGPNQEEKRHIATVAANLIQDNEWVFLGPGSTCFCIAEQLAGRSGLNIITNNLQITALLSRGASFNAYLTGGEIDRSGQFTSGEMFERALSGIYFTKAIVSVDGIDFNNGYTVGDMKLLNVYRRVKDITREMIVAADHTKFDRFSYVKTGDINAFQTVISNEKMPASYKEYFFTNNIKAFTAYDLGDAFSGRP